MPNEKEPGGNSQIEKTKCKCPTRENKLKIPSQKEASGNRENRQIYKFRDRCSRITVFYFVSLEMPREYFERNNQVEITSKKDPCGN